MSNSSNDMCQLCSIIMPFEGASMFSTIMIHKMVDDPTHPWAPVPVAAPSVWRADRFRDTLEGLMVGETPTDDLVKRANKLLESLAWRPDPNEFTPRWSRRCTTKVNKILEAMLVFSSQCGGEEGQHYAACAIIACTAGSRSSEGTHVDLTDSDLAINWFSNFLWTCKSLL